MASSVEKLKKNTTTSEFSSSKLHLLLLQPYTWHFIKPYIHLAHSTFYSFQFSYYGYCCFDVVIQLFHEVPTHNHKIFMLIVGDFQPKITRKDRKTAAEEKSRKRRANIVVVNRMLILGMITNDFEWRKRLCVLTNNMR